jgi:hypothetical protein
MVIPVKFFIFLAFSAAIQTVDAASSPSPSPSLSSSQSVGAPFAIDTVLEGPTSPYTRFLLDLLKRWPAHVRGRGVDDASQLKLECFATEGNPTYVGLSQKMLIQAGLPAVAAVLDDFGHYQELFPGYDDVHVISRDRNRIETYWEQHIPFFFIPNVKLEVTYLVDASRSDRRTYRYQLRNSKSVKNNDGLIVIESLGPSLTRYTEYDFFDADWGLLKSLGEDKVWTESLNGIYLSDVAIQLKAEKPTLTYAQIKEESEKSLDRNPTLECWKNRKKLDFGRSP